MSWLDGLRMRVIHGAGEPDRSPKRYAPYSVWSIARVIGAVGFAALPLAILAAIAGWFGLAILLGVIGIVIVVPVQTNNLIALAPEIIGGLLGSRYCPACGQSIFDDAPASGYMSDAARGRWWPARHCANCGHDLKLRTHEEM